MLARMVLIGISIFEIGLLYWLLCSTVLQKKYFGKKDWAIIGGNTLGLGTILGINRSLSFFSSSLFIIIFVITCICVLLVKKQNKLLQTVIITLYYSTVALLDFFFASVGMMILGKKFDGMVYTRANSWTECIIFISSRLIITGCIRMFAKQKYEETYICEFQAILSIISIIMCLILRWYQIEVVKMIYENGERDARAVGASLAAVLLIVSFIGILCLKNKTLEKEKEILVMRDFMMTQKFKELESVIEKNRQLSHDLRNHLIALKNYEKEGNYEGINSYIEEIQHEFFEIKVRAWTGNQIADMIMEQKRALAEQEGIIFTIQAIPIAEWFFSDSETCSLLGNLLDNAVDACKRMDVDAKRWIFIKIEKQKQLLFIRIMNSIGEAPVMKKGKPISVKDDKKNHGYGLRSVERIVNRYDGVITYQMEEKFFQVNLSF